MSFTDIADQRLLDSAKSQLGELRWDVEADSDLRIPVPPDVDGILRLIPRRGLEPLLVSRLFELFPNRPLERALLAWDIAQGALLGRNDGELVARLSNELAPLKQIGAKGDVAIPRDRVATLIEAARPSSTVGLLQDYETMPSLAALVALSAARSNFDDKPDFVDLTVAHVKRLSLAHLPSLAMAFLQILWDRFAVEKARHLIIEIGLDFRRFDAIPQMEAQDDVSLQLQAYAGLRGNLELNAVSDATNLIEILNNIPAVRDSTYASLQLARVELALLQNKRIDAGTANLINTVAPPESGWRYAVQVRDSIAMQTNPDTVAQSLARGISRFGNNATLWRRAARHPQARAELLTCLSREVRYVSHDPEVWRALAAFTSNGDAIETEVQQRLRSQLNAALI